MHYPFILYMKNKWRDLHGFVFTSLIENKSDSTMKVKCDSMFIPIVFRISMGWIPIMQIFIVIMWNYFPNKLPSFRLWFHRRKSETSRLKKFICNSHFSWTEHPESICGSQTLVMDHLIPWNAGGSRELDKT